MIYTRPIGNKIIFITKIGNPRSCPHKVLLVALAVKKSAFVLQRWQSRKAWPLNPANICFGSLSQSLPFTNLLLLLPWLLRFAVWVLSWSSMSCMFVSLVVSVWVLCSLVWSLYEFCVVWYGLVWFACCCVARYREVKVNIRHINFLKVDIHHRSERYIWMSWYPPISFSIPGMQISVHVTFTQMLD